MTRPEDQRLCELADHLNPALADRLRELLAADGQAHRYHEVAQRLQRSEDLVREMRRQMGPLRRQADEVRPLRQQGQTLRAALHVVLSHADGSLTGDAQGRRDELAGCRVALEQSVAAATPRESS